MFRVNEGPLDRAIRIVGGAALIAVGLTVLDALDGSVLGIVVSAFGLWLVITGAIGFCPLYVLLGIDTLPKRRTTSFGPIETPTVRRSRDHALR
jgi:uncharacterized membrane protein